MTLYLSKEVLLNFLCGGKEKRKHKIYDKRVSIEGRRNFVYQGLRIKKELPNLEIIIPGHGKNGGEALLDYTIQLFKNIENKNKTKTKKICWIFKFDNFFFPFFFKIYLGLILLKLL